MPQRPSDPGVHMREAPSGPPSIASASTSVAAFVGWLPKGPVNEPVQIFSFSDFERVFDGLHVDSELSYAIQQFFQNGGSEAWVVRTVADDALRSSKEIPLTTGSGKITFEAANKGAWGDQVEIAVLPSYTENGDTYFDLVARKIKEEIQPNGTKSKTVLEQETYQKITKSEGGEMLSSSDLIQPETTSDGKSLPGIPQPTTLLKDDFKTLPFSGTSGQDVLLEDTSGSSPTPVVAVYHDPASSDQFRLYIMNQADLPSSKQIIDSSDIQVETELLSVSDVERIHDLSSIGLNLKTLSFSHSGSFSSPQQGDATEINGSSSHSINVGDVDVTFTKDSKDGSLVFYKHGTSGDERLKAVWYEGSSKEAEEVFADEEDLIAKAIAGLLSIPVNVDVSLIDRPAATGPWATVKDLRNRFIPLEGGDDGAVPGDDNWTGASGDSKGAAALTGDNTSANKPGGFEKLKDIKPDRFNILCMPDAAQLKEGAMISTYSKALTFCEDQDAFMIVDSPAHVNTGDKFDQFQNIRDWFSNGSGTDLRHENAAFYFPQIQIPDSEQSFQPRKMGASGTLAGVYARTDTNRGVWKAPAGMQATLGAADPVFQLNSDQRGTLNDMGINTLRSLPNTGAVSWGARTLVGYNNTSNPDSKYVPVRRMELFLKQSLEAGMTWAVFEPNNETLWGQIRLTVKTFMNRLFQQGAFKGETAGEAYFVKCDSSTTTQDDINRGIVNVVVGFAPLKPAEFVVITIKQKAGQDGG